MKFAEKFGKKEGKKENSEIPKVVNSGIPDFVFDDDGVQEPPALKKTELPKKANSGKLKVVTKDNGLFVCVAEEIGKTADSYYYEDWDNGAPTPDRHAVGDGLPNVTRVNSIFDCIRGLDNEKKPTGKRPDLIVLPDVGKGDFQEFVNEELKEPIPVFGTGYSEELEDDRIEFRSLLKELGLLVSPYEVINKGKHRMDRLRERLQEVEDKWIKLSLYRGIGETFYHENYDKSYQKLNEWAHRIGILDHMVEIIIEDPIKAVKGKPVVEIGAEWMHTRPGFLPVGLYGYEDKNKSYLGKAVRFEELPWQISSVMKAFQPIYNKYGVFGQLSVEMRVNAEGSYFIDPCQRFASPPGESVLKVYKNLVNVMYAVAQGIMPEPEDMELAHTYFAQVMLHLDGDPQEPMTIDIDKKYENNLAIRNLSIVDGQRYFFPIGKETIVGAALGWGESKDEAMDMAMEVAKSVKADVSFDTDTFSRMKETIAKGEELGMQM